MSAPSSVAAPASPALPAPPRFRPVHLAILAAVAIAHSAFVAYTWSDAYIDFGDGNYLYIASRIADGVVPYRDILAPQPPCHLYLGAAVVGVSRLLGAETPILAARVASLLLHLATALLVVSLARRAWGRCAEAVAAGAIFLALPIDTWWSMGWQSEPLEVFFLLLMARAALPGTRRGDLAAAAFGSLAAFTNATAAPFLLAVLVFMAIRDRARALRIGGTALAIAAVVVAAFEVRTDGHFLRTVVLDQAGTYPPGRFLEYAWMKIRREGGDMLRLEGPFVALTLVGIGDFLRRSPLPSVARGGLATLLVATLFSFLYVTKGGTVDYIFSLAGPALAIFGAGPACDLARLARGRAAAGRLLATLSGGGPDGHPSGGGLRGVPFAAILAIGWFLQPALVHYVRLWNQSAFELPDLPPDRMSREGEPIPNVARVREWILARSGPGDAILAPPFYAVLTGRKLHGEYSEIFIWTIKDKNDRDAANPDGPGWTKTREIADAIRRREIPIVLIELDQTGRLPEIRDAIDSGYRSLTETPYRTLNTRLGVFVPREEPR